MALGLAAGMPPDKVLKSIQTGFGEALGFIAVVVGLGAMIGRFLEHSGGGRALADWLLEKFGNENAPPGPCWSRPFWWAADLLRSRLHHSGAAGVEPGARNQTVAAVLRAADGRRADHHAFAGAAASGAGGRVATARRRSRHAPSSTASRVSHPDGDRRPASFTAGGSRGASLCRCPKIAERARAQPTDGSAAPPVPVVVLLLLLPVLLIFGATMANLRNVPFRGVAVFLGHPFTALAIAAAGRDLLLRHAPRARPARRPPKWPPSRWRPWARCSASWAAAAPSNRSSWIPASGPYLGQAADHLVASRR